MMLNFTFEIFIEISSPIVGILRLQKWFNANVMGFPIEVFVDILAWRLFGLFENFGFFQIFFSPCMQMTI